MDKLSTLSYSINLAFNFKCYSILLILVYNKIWLSLAAVCQVVLARIEAEPSLIKLYSVPLHP